MKTTVNIEGFEIILMPNSNDNLNVHSAMYLPLVMAKCCGFFPVQGLGSRDYRDLKFSWLSIWSIYSMLITIFISIDVLAQGRKVLLFDDSIIGMNVLVFLLCGLCSNILFFRLSREWPSLMETWHDVEINLGNNEIKINLKRKVKVLVFIFFLGATIENGLIQAYNIVYVIKCTKTAPDAIKRFFANLSQSHIFFSTEYALWKAILFTVIHLQATFSWTFSNVFIIVISTSLAMRVNQLKRKIKKLANHGVDSLIHWRQIREEHLKLYNLCSTVDQKISYIIVLSFFINMYFTLTQLYGSMDGPTDPLIKAYSFFSFSFLIARAVCVCLYGASINEESNQYLPILLSISTNCYNIEIKRFIDQISHTKMAITGKNFFTITKGLILNIAGAIVTYELVLIQFEQLDHDDPPPPPPTDPSWIC